MGDAFLIAASGFLLGFLRGVAGLVLALVLYCLFYLAIAALHKIRRHCLLYTSDLIREDNAVLSPYGLLHRADYQPMLSPMQETQKMEMKMK